MTACADTDDYRALFLSHTPLIDIRAPAEFARGAFPMAMSMPLMTDDERAQVGICYKAYGQRSAIQLGHQLVSGDTKARRLARWLDFVREHPGGYLYCWRGGLRSEIVQAWLRDAGVSYPRVVGGYKAMRRFLIDELERSVADASFVLVSGKTGTGKTRVIARLARAVDLEGLANHRGSSFGQLPAPQPSQIDFENALSIALLRQLAAGRQPICLEDEGGLIGALSLPDCLRKKMAVAPLLIVEQSLDERVDVLIQDYVVDLGRRYTLRFGEEGPVRHCEKLQSDLARIRKRLGPQRQQEINDMMIAAFDAQWRVGDVSGHRTWISRLLVEYYDPMYAYQLSRRQGVRCFTGDRQAVVTWVQEGGAGAEHG
ncbi:MAG: tRNA 2-selenouridine(34) synthase MnmH [Halioglobus sp.]|nr:tRNA 2-selenouridine(34) synthase MnmH [Halioglobus sp.]